MFCGKCGAENDDNAYQCVNCGEKLHFEAAKPVAVPQTSGKAIASLVCSIAGIFVCPFIGHIIGVVLGYSARAEIRESEGRLGGEGLASAGIVLGWIGIALTVFVMLLLFMGMARHGTAVYH